MGHAKKTIKNNKNWYLIETINILIYDKKEE